MRIEQICTIKEHKIFRNFTWTEDTLSPFKEKNLLYGWNGTGKSTLSNLFRAIEKHTPIKEGDVKFIIDAREVDGSHLDTIADLPLVRVFNKNFIADNVFTTEGTVSPIFFLGEENIEKQKQIIDLKAELGEINTTKNEITQRKNSLDGIFRVFKQDRARLIKEELRAGSNITNHYNNYNHSLFESRCNQLLSLPEPEQRLKELSSDQLHIQKQNKNDSPRDKLDYIDFKYPDTQELTNQVSLLLKKTVLSDIIDMLKNDPELSSWVQTGLTKHKKENSSECLFCGQLLPLNHLKRIESHFNDEYNGFINKIKSLLNFIQSEMKNLDSYKSHHRLSLYPHLHAEYDIKCKNISEDIRAMKEYLQTMYDILKEKSEQPFQVLATTVTSISKNTENLLQINEIITTHNAETDNFQSKINTARSTIADSMVASSLSDYCKQTKDIEDLGNNINIKEKERIELTNKIKELERSIETHHKPAEELTKDICNYLGRWELTFEIKDGGYQISRDGAIAENLSEGEKTAIAFLYFLKSLKDKSFSLSEGIVVIDDPVSSLDSNTLFYAFAFMKEAIKDVNQLFILTHNHTFFSQVKNWFNHLPKQKKSNRDLHKANFYMLNTDNKLYNGSRSSVIIELDNLLHRYESEYHYLFSLIYYTVNPLESTPTVQEDSNLQQYYSLPNIARRLLEAFFAFRKPSKSGELLQQMELTGFDNTKSIRIIRFVQTHSHAGYIAGPEHDLSILTETRSILSDILCLIREEDSSHYMEMETLITQNEAPLNLKEIAIP